METDCLTNAISTFPTIENIETLIAVRATNRDALIKHMERFIRERPPNPSSSLLAIDFKKGLCKCSKEYPALSDIPFHSEQCPHGNYFIKYDEE